MQWWGCWLDGASTYSCAFARGQYNVITDFPFDGVFISIAKPWETTACSNADRELVVLREVLKDEDLEYRKDNVLFAVRRNDKQMTYSIQYFHTG